MKTLELYKSYSETMNRMNMLRCNQERLQNENAEREQIFEVTKQILYCRKKLQTILNQITNNNPFENKQQVSQLS